MTDGAQIYDFAVRSQIAKLQSEVEALKSGGGGDNSGGMEARVAKLEADVTHLVGDVTDLRASAKEAGKTLSDLRERMAKVETKIDHLPSKGFIVTAVLSSLAIIAAIIVFQGEVQHLLHLSSSTQR